MVYCRYCGAKNRDCELKCFQCNKLLSLISDNSSSRLNSKSNNFSNLNNNSSNYNNQSNHIKSKYLEKDHDPNEYVNNNQQSDFRTENPQNQRINNLNINQSKQLYQSRHDPNIRNQQYQNPENVQNYSKTPYELHDRRNRSQNREKYLKVGKTTVEWDIVITTALIVIILTKTLQRIFPFMAIFIVLLIGLAYILIATKSKSSLFKSIPLAILTILTISAYFSI